jgi:hypothetical protein
MSTQRFGGSSDGPIHLDWEKAMTASLSGRELAEFPGTALLVLFGAGSVVAALEVGGGRLDYTGLGIVALASGLVVALVIVVSAADTPSKPVTPTETNPPPGRGS